jgi:hypothetical protein
MTKDQERIESCLAVVDAYEASGQKASEWAQGHGVKLRDLASWCGHAKRWRARLAGAVHERASRQTPEGFVAARLSAVTAAAASAAAGLATVRVEVGANSAAAAVALHWPLSHARELATWVREVAR